MIGICILNERFLISWIWVINLRKRRCHTAMSHLLYFLTLKMLLHFVWYIFRLFKRAFLRNNLYQILAKRIVRNHSLLLMESKTTSGTLMLMMMMTIMMMMMMMIKVVSCFRESSMAFFRAGTFTRWIFYHFKCPISYEQDLNRYQIYILKLIYEFETSIGSS